MTLSTPKVPVIELPGTAPKVPTSLDDPYLYLNRELSWIEFNRRVLEEAQDARTPLYERLKFVGIVASNLDEFFMVRVAGLKQQLASGVAETAADRVLPAEQLRAISQATHKQVEDLYALWQNELVPALAERGISLLFRKDITPAQKRAARAHFTAQVFPALTPLAVDPGHPFPHLRNKSINVAILLKRGEKSVRRTKRSDDLSLAVVQVPSVLQRLVRIPSDDETKHTFILLGELIATCADDLFPGFSVVQSCAFRVTRNWDMSIDDEDSEDLLSTIQDELRRRDRGAAVRLEIEASSAPELERALASALKLDADDVYRVAGPLQIDDLVKVADYDLHPDFRVEAHTPVLPPAFSEETSIVSLVAQRDILLHHPYESFDPVIRFIDEAADDPAVLAIKMTLYRISGDSPLVRALGRAAENGKQVAVLMELKARFDEANNIAWARRLEESGVHVVYGLIGLKTHCKVAMVVRRDEGGIKRYVHLGTGNYNPTTARLYTDLSLFTVRQELADDVSGLFNMLTGLSDEPRWKRLSIAPHTLRRRVVELIQREAELATKGEPSAIVAKMNSLVDPVVIRALYEASQAGVPIDLVVRGICCLRPGVAGISENIRVTSIVDRFLEHNRVYAFGAGDRMEVYAASADWMPRNFLRRVEVMYPIEDPRLAKRVWTEVLELALRDNVKARILNTDGTYQRVVTTEPEVRSQKILIDIARQSRDALPTIRHAAARTDEMPIPRRAGTEGL